MAVQSIPTSCVQSLPRSPRDPRVSQVQSQSTHREACSRHISVNCGSPDPLPVWVVTTTEGVIPRIAAGYRAGGPGRPALGGGPHRRVHPECTLVFQPRVPRIRPPPACGGVWLPAGPEASQCFKQPAQHPGGVTFLNNPLLVLSPLPPGSAISGCDVGPTDGALTRAPSSATPHPHGGRSVGPCET